MAQESGEQLNLDDWGNEHEKELQGALDKAEGNKLNIREMIFGFSESDTREMTEDTSNILSSAILRKIPSLAERSDLSLAYKTIFLPQKNTEYQQLLKQYEELEPEGKKVDHASDQGYPYKGNYFRRVASINNKRDELLVAINSAQDLIKYFRNLEKALELSTLKEEEFEKAETTREEFIESLIQAETEKKEELKSQFEEHEITIGSDENEKVRNIIDIIANIGESIDMSAPFEQAKDIGEWLRRLSSEIKLLIPESNDRGLLVERYKEEIKKEYSNLYELKNQQIKTEPTEESKGKLAEQLSKVARLQYIVKVLERII